MKVPFVDLKKQYESIKDEISDAIQWCLDNTRFIGGKPLTEFEENFARICDSKYAIGTGSGTAALSLALKAHGIGPGDEVIVPAHTFIATAEAVSSVGAKFVLVDIDKKTYNIDPIKIREAITPNTKAIIPVHLYGNPAEMDLIIDIAEENGLSIIEDACQAHLAEYKGKKMPYSSTACFSFFPGKNLGAYGDAGAVVTDNADIQKKVIMLRNHGREPGHKYDSTIEAFGHRMDSLQAAILNVKLKHIERWTELRRKNASYYNRSLENVPVTIPFEAKDSKHVYHIYSILADNRDGLLEFLKENGISAGIHYPVPIHLQPAYKDRGWKRGDFPISEKICDHEISLPMFPELTKDQIEYTVGKIKEFIIK